MPPPRMPDSPMKAICSSLHLPICSICYQTDEHDILKANKPILMQSDTSGPQDKGMKRSRSTLGARRSKVKVRRRQNRSQKSCLARYLKNHPMNSHQTYAAYYSNCPLCHKNSDTKDQRSRSHEAWQTHHSQPP